MKRSGTANVSEARGEAIEIFGARTNNLQDIDVAIPSNQFVVITGKSGSGKSSLAIDTLFAEGQRQYIESLSLNTRQILHQSALTDVDRIEGLPPTVCINQRPGLPNPRSTVGTLSEIHDYLRVLYAKVGQIRCVNCNADVSPVSIQQIVEFIQRLPDSTKVMLLAPVPAQVKPHGLDAVEIIRKERLVRVRIQGELYDIDRLPNLDAVPLEFIEAVTDRIIVREGIDDRLFESAELAAKLGAGSVQISYKLPDNNDWQEQAFSTASKCSHCGTPCSDMQPRSFSFNSPEGACGECGGLGRTESFDVDRIVPNDELSIDEGAIALWHSPESGIDSKQVALLKPALEALKFSTSLPIAKLDREERDKLFFNFDSKQPGLVQILEREYSTTLDDDRLDELEQYRTAVSCQACQGTRLNQQARAVSIQGMAISQFCDQPVDEAIEFVSGLNFADETAGEIAKPLVEEITNRLVYLSKVGLAYLTLNRSSDTLSGGELQRVRLAKSIGNRLTGACYILDEPSVGLHSGDSRRLIEVVRELIQLGNSVVVVEHDEQIIRSADHIVEIGPDAGPTGGQVVFAGSLSSINSDAECSTASYLSGAVKIELGNRERTTTGNTIQLRGASGFNLQDVDVDFPIGRLTCVTGVSGSGKSTLINKTLVPAVKQHLGLATPAPQPFESIEYLSSIERIVQVDQRPLTRTPRGCAATFTGLFADVRKIFASTRAAKRLGFPASRFSFNAISGRCPVCLGHGVRRVSMQFMPDVFVRCEGCRGSRFNEQTLQVSFRNLNIADVLRLSVAEALNEFSSFERIHGKLQCLEDVGLGYLKLGQPANTLSGGEAQRIKLARELAQTTCNNTLYLLDEPTTGLHFADVQRLLNVLDSLVQSGNTMIVIEHNLDLIRHADWVVDLGPQGGPQGGRVVAEGTPSQVADNEESLTGHCLKDCMA